MRQKIYIDTSVFGGVFDIEFEMHSKQLFQAFQQGKKIPIISNITLLELEQAPANVRNLIQDIPEQYCEHITLNQEAKSLALKYIEEQVVTEKFLLDAQHIALASIHRVDVLVSWNFKHIVNLRRIHLYNAVNLKYSYPMIEIRSPREVIDEEENF